MSTICVTNSMRTTKSCTLRDTHRETCDGWRGTRECRGCMPRPADRGMLCWTCWEALNSEIAIWYDFAAIIQNIDRAVTPDSSGPTQKPGSRVIIPQTRLDIDEVESHLASLKSVNGNLERWVSTVDGATDSINFMHAARRARRSHEIEERPHRVRVKCPSCGTFGLVWFPVESVGAEVSVRCRYDGCGFVADQSDFEELAFQAEIKNRKKVGRN